MACKYLFLGLEAIDDEGLKRYRKRTTLDANFEALDYARSLGMTVAVNIIADPDWDEARFRTVREWCLEIPEVVNISVNTPYPGTEIWQTEQRRVTTRDYRLYDIQHAVLPTRLPLDRFYKELVATQAVLNRKHLGWSALSSAASTAARLAARGQTNFIKMLWKFNQVYNPDRLLADHAQPSDYLMTPPPPHTTGFDPKVLYVHEPRGRKGRALDDETERFVDATRMGVGS